MDWFRLPMSVLRSYLSMLPRLRAEENLREISGTMIATGHMEEKAAERALKDLQRAASDPSEKPKRLTPQERHEAIKASGWFVVEEV